MTTLRYLVIMGAVDAQRYPRSWPRRESRHFHYGRSCSRAFPSSRRGSLPQQPRQVPMLPYVALPVLVSVLLAGEACLVYAPGCIVQRHGQVLLVPMPLPAILLLLERLV